VNKCPQNDYQNKDRVMNKKQIPIENITSKPFPSIARITTIRKKGFRLLSKQSVFQSTGALVNNRYLFTSAHNIFSTKFSWIESAELRFGYQNGISLWDAPKKYSASSFKIAKHYNWNIFSKDYAVIDLGIDAPNQQTSFRLPKVNELIQLAQESTKLYFAGYPGAEGHNGQILKGATTESFSLDQKFLNYDIDTATGNSGGPVWFEKDGEYILAGIHGSEGKATALVSEVLTEVNSWIKKDI
jgi:V8-like Glu-specific endopeptidase